LAVAVKLIMTWNIAPEHEQEYFEFVVREFIPGVKRLGFELSDAWATVFGSFPQIMVTAVIPTVQEARHLLNSSEWQSLNNQLQDFVKDYSQKIVQAQNGFQF
jgi:DNA-binding transcriptional regulator GbsR (MarR family)